ncbi:GCN5-related N-acetyltransferase [Nostoc commune NIES-4072]|uniref:GCN5-related N-acetyltransferase n=1 Tax=Nostoc commune NIES-4072 TaxID=2005467 RepID=A0A2R5FNG9_NOSCO|nr:GNAT family N-acetyltransferase [Nostoc commune]BBD68684.1 GCN5-related N-acetyltransferase [Nostoc commune HK-02]GBG20316.1 GCN5-related N-acetyltransferase [Nostoc commune NIES-4072]
MIRLTKPEDAAALIAVANTIGFEPNELEELGNMLADYLEGNSDSERFWITDDDDKDGPVGVAYCEPERMTDQTWNLQLIAIHPDHQGQGRGGKLLRYVEETLKACGGRMLLVETLASFERTRSFYAKYGYEEEARIRDFYTAGADKIVFRKVLNAD